jgi:rare lipoprotein A
MSRKFRGIVGLGTLCVLAACTQTPPAPTPAPTAQQEVPPPQEPEQTASKVPAKPKIGHLDHSGSTVEGRASYISPHLANRKMADGGHLDPESNVIASKTLPLGTKARVTNPANGKSTVVTVADRGPFVKGRVADVTPKVADELDMRKKGVGSVVVAPISVPQADGSVKAGAGAHQADKDKPENEASR